ncbi:MAG: HAD-IIB family hydrolase [Chitinophagales bacterium]|nr:HAD-IIB family hydrolase [Chitinophagales bacterium]
MKYLIFTDLDGTLIDHHSYDGAAAIQAVQRLQQNGIPLIFCSSKTFAEQVPLQRYFGLRQPFIVENGSAIAIPEHYFPNLPEGAHPFSEGYVLLPLGEKSIRDIRRVLARINRQRSSKLFGFTALTLGPIATATALSRKAAALARQRQFTETLLSEPPDASAMQVLEAAGFSCSRGGRFISIQDKNIDKGKAVLRLLALFQEHLKVHPATIGIGDSHNDLPMLAACDRAFLVQKPDGRYTQTNATHIKTLPAVGPEGFSMMVAQLLQKN